MSHSSLQQNYPPSHQRHPPSASEQYRPAFNQDELRVLRECNRESFYFRCVPFAAALSTAAYFAMRQGVLKVSHRFGYAPKMFGAAFVGYFTGKLSYQNACAEKLMQLPDSPVGEALRKRKGRLGFQDTLGVEPGFSVGFPSNELGTSDSQEPIFDDHRPDLRDHNEGLDDYERGVTESLTPYTEVSPNVTQQHTTYQELRRQNREEYVSKMAEKYRRPPLDHIPESSSSSLPSEDHQPTQPIFKPPPLLRNSVKKNQYGDDIFE